MRTADPPTFYRVVVNHEGCYCIWPNDVVLPPGWKQTGFSSTVEVALNQVAELWHTRFTQPCGRTDDEADTDNH